MEERRLSGIIQAQEQQLGMLVEQSKVGEDIVNYLHVLVTARQVFPDMYSSLVGATYTS